MDKALNHIRFLKDSKIHLGNQKGLFHPNSSDQVDRGHIGLQEVGCCKFLGHKGVTDWSLPDNSVPPYTGHHGFHLMALVLMSHPDSSNQLDISLMVLLS